MSAERSCPVIAKKFLFFFTIKTTIHTWGRWSVIGYSNSGTPLHERTCEVCGASNTYMGTP